MQALNRYKSSSSTGNPGCAEFMTLAERELSAFFHAVVQLFGPQQAQLSAEDWLRELTGIASLPASTREWRLISLRVLTRLAARVNASALSTELIHA